MSKQASPFTFSSLPGIPERIRVERRHGSAYYDVSCVDDDLLRLVDNPDALANFIAGNETAYPDGMESPVLELSGDGDDLTYTASDLAAGHGKVLGDANVWYLPSEDVHLTFHFYSPWGRGGLVGGKVLALRSHDGPAWDHFALIPPGVDPETASSQIKSAICALAERDAALPAGQEGGEYTVKDVIAAVEKAGCIWIDAPIELGVNWDVP